MSRVILFEDKKECCGCGACAMICPKKAIIIEEDTYGFTYPIIDEKLCVSCMKCKSVCNFKGPLTSPKPTETLIAVRKDKDRLMKSASGGAFAVIAENFIKEQGFVYGCSMETIDGKLTPIHIEVHTIEDLLKLYGSKYVQSDVGVAYAQVKKRLDAGNRVLFSGTPCQVDGLIGYLGGKSENLFLIDIICHGTANRRFFQDYIALLNARYRKRVTSIVFRDKERGWNHIGKVLFDHQKGKSINKNISSYYAYFLQCETFRESCYHCKYACKSRVSDLTLGDYWGISMEHPELIASHQLDIQYGVSLILVNSMIGTMLIQQSRSGLTLFESTIEQAAMHNSQLNYPGSHSALREKIMALYAADGYRAVDTLFRKSHSKEIILFQMKEYGKKVLPELLIQKIKSLLKRSFIK